MGNTGMLYLVATPIGNLEDITLRALRVLREADIIAAEDTRQTLKLLNHFEIKNRLVSYYEHNKTEKGNYLIGQLMEGKDVALVSDAGSPGISDPGEELVGMAAEKGINVTMVPGPAAVIAGVVLSGLPSGRFGFEGFLPVNKRVRSKRIQAVKDDTRTLVFYEAPHKLIHTLKDLRSVLGNRRISLARELTKKFEEIWRTTLDEAIDKYEHETPKGEFVLVIEGADEEALERERISSWEELSLTEHVRFYMEEGLDKKAAMKKVSEDRKISKREVYNSLVEKKESSNKKDPAINTTGPHHRV
ncbi:MAG: 16S rRNA (cytidine(1402)-2'-O)-methyltransferase [Clostridiaceae bacterium]|nr:16S rRNA (cytidine(1402)-2'-O)-methyltransferase [Clostridiaceae bacterium]